jgi:hypothetical protein
MARSTHDEDEPTKIQALQPRRTWAEAARGARRWWLELGATLIGSHILHELLRALLHAVRAI